MHRVWADTLYGVPDEETFVILRDIGEKALRDFLRVAERSFSDEKYSLSNSFQDAVLSEKYCQIALAELPEIVKLFEGYAMQSEEGGAPPIVPILKKIGGGGQSSPRAYGHLSLAVPA